MIEEKEVIALRGKFISLVKTYLGTADGAKFVEELANTPQTANSFPFKSLQATARKGGLSFVFESRLNSILITEKRKSLLESTPMKPSFTMPKLPVEKEKPLQNASSKTEKENQIKEEQQKESVKKGGQTGKRKRFSEAEDDDDSDEDYSPPVKTAAKRKSLPAGSKANSFALSLSRASKTG